jgi:thiopurine S-methyltransferase
METQYWMDSWERGGRCTSFHRSGVHPYVAEHCPPDFLAGKRVLVPLCGKTLDLLWFRAHAAHVVGVELCPLAVEQFFAENGVPFRREGDRFEAERLTILVRDILTLDPREVGTFDLVYDCAALVALPHDTRFEYVAKLEELTRPGSIQLVATLEYDSDLAEEAEWWATPPFSVSPSDIDGYYRARWRIERRASVARPDHDMVRRFGIASMVEHAFMLFRAEDGALCGQQGRAARASFASPGPVSEVRLRSRPDSQHPGDANGDGLGGPAALRARNR